MAVAYKQKKTRVETRELGRGGKNNIPSEKFLMNLQNSMRRRSRTGGRASRKGLPRVEKSKWGPKQNQELSAHHKRRSFDK